MSTNTCRAGAGAALLAALGLAMSPAASADSDAELAKKAQNPIAAMISLPLQLNYDEGYGATG
ncbi:MAG: transporter, partial [Proteobacteria bacterium]|nr:transporter [Pseudomonadota bacterium]